MVAVFFGVLFLEAIPLNLLFAPAIDIGVFSCKAFMGLRKTISTGAKCWTLVSDSKNRSLKRSNHHDHSRLVLMGEGVTWVETSDVLARSPFSRHVTFVRISQTFSVADRLTGR